MTIPENQERWQIVICPKCRQIAYADDDGCCENCGEWLGGEGTGDEDHTLTIEVNPASNEHSLREGVEEQAAYARLRSVELTAESKRTTRAGEIRTLAAAGVWEVVANRLDSLLTPASIEDAQARCPTCGTDQIVMIPGVGRECPDCGVIDYSDSLQPTSPEDGEQETARGKLTEDNMRDEIERLQSANDSKAEAINAALDELGVPGDDYPTPATPEQAPESLHATDRRGPQKSVAGNRDVPRSYPERF